MEFLFLLVGLFLGFIITFLFFKLKRIVGADTSLLDGRIVELEKEKIAADEKFRNAIALKEEISIELKSEREKLSSANTRLAKAEEAFKNQNEKFATQKNEIEELQKKFKEEFENIANRLLDEKSKKFTEQNKTNLDIILNPLKEKIKDFEAKVEKAYNTERDERITLKAEIKNLMDGTKQISEDANNLTKALKGDNKKQGNWGEVILEKVLERSGLVKGQEYETQYSTNNDEGKRIQPDVLIKLPDNKHIVVDSKVSLIAYEAFVNADTEELKERFSKEHTLSIRNHVKLLSEKNYSASPDFNSPDFVLLFIPIESSFSLAVQLDQELFSFAWDKKVVIVSPSTLLATLRTIASIWKQERQTKNAIEIAKQSGLLYDKFVGFIEDMDKIGKSIDASKFAYEGAINKLHKGSGNLVKKAQDIEKLGAKTTKQIPSKFIESDESPLLTEGEKE